MPQLDVFISSKMVELKAERDVLFELIPTLGKGIIDLHAWVFEEDAPATSKSIRQVYLDALRDSALYIGLLWNLYGEWTIDEFDRATEWGIERHIYVKDVDAHEREPELKEFLGKIGDVQFGLTQKWFKTPDDLREAVKQSVNAWLDEYTSGPPGDLSARLYTTADDVLERPEKLIGRADLMAEAQGQLDRGGRVLLQGAAGTGKTALAAEVATQRIIRGNGPVLWVRAGRHKPDALFDALARTFDQHQALAKLAGDEKIHAMRALLAGCGAKLLVIDDVWNGPALGQLVKAMPPNLTLLVTSRQRYPLPHILNVGVLQRPDSQAVLSHYAANDWSSDKQADALCDMLGDLAYALRIAGRLLAVRGRPPVELLADIKDAPQHMTLPLGFEAGTGESFARLLEVSLNALPDDARNVFLAFGALFSRTATAELLTLFFEGTSEIPDEMLAETRSEIPNAAKISDDELRSLMRQAALGHNIDTRSVESALTTLEDHGLAERIAPTDNSAAFYRVHDLAYAYARTQNDDAARDRAVDACLAYTRRYNQSLPANFAALRPELDNFLGAADWAFQRERRQPVEQFAWYLYAGQDAVGGFLLYQGFYAQAVRLLGQAAAAAGNQGDRSGQGAHLGHLGLAYDNLGQYDVAIGYFEQALAIARETGDRHSEGASLGNLGSAYDSLGKVDKAIDYHQQALAIAREIGDRHGDGASLDNLGMAYANPGQVEEAIEYHKQALAIDQEIGAKREQGNSLGNLGLAYANQGQYDQAIGYLEQALAIQCEIGDKRGQGNQLGNLGLVYYSLGQYDEAIDYFQQALAIARDIGDRPGEGNWLGNLGGAYANLGQVDKAIDYFQQALAIARDIGDRRGEGVDLGNLGLAYANLGQHEKAVDHCQQALAIARETGDQRSEANTLLNIGALHKAQGEYTRAVEFYRQARVIYEELKLAYMVEFADRNIAKAQATGNQGSGKKRWPWQRKR